MGTTLRVDSIGPLMSVIDTYRFLGISHAKLSQLMRDKQIPHLKIDRQVKFSRPVLEVWVDSQRIDKET